MEGGGGGKIYSCVHAYVCMMQHRLNAKDKFANLYLSKICRVIFFQDLVFKGLHAAHFFNFNFYFFIFFKFLFLFFQDLVFEGLHAAHHRHNWQPPVSSHGEALLVKGWPSNIIKVSPKQPNWKEIRSPHFRACIYSCLFCGFKEKPGGAETDLGANCRGVLYSFTQSVHLKKLLYTRTNMCQTITSHITLSTSDITEKHKLPPWCMLNTGERFTGWFANSAGRQQKWGGRSKEGGGLQDWRGPPGAWGKGTRETPSVWDTWLSEF